MSRNEIFDVAIIGGGIVGLAVARALSSRRPRVAVLEAERRLAAHQTGRNSGVIHSGLYYEPGSSKAVTCVEGRRELYEYCRNNAIAHECCGKLVVATNEAQESMLDALEQRGRANGLDGLKQLDASKIRDREPHVRVRRGLWVPQTGIVDFGQVAETMARQLQGQEIEIRTGARVTSILRRPSGFVLRYHGGELQARNLINCAGLQSDRIARMCGLRPGLRIVPFRGEYLKLAPHREILVWNLVYPAPHPRLPFLGVHFTRTIHGEVKIGPSILLSLSREGYAGFNLSARDALSTLSYVGFWRLAARHLGVGLRERYRKFNRGALVRQLRKMVPEINPADLRKDGVGIRAQAVEPDGTMVDDFRFLEAERMLHVLNAPSPAATASLAIGHHVARRAEQCLALG